MTDHPIPFAALDGKVGVLGATGSGKTFTAIGLVERMLDAGYQVIIIDPTGAYAGLRTAFPIPIFGGKFGDVPVREEDGAAVARAIIDGNLSAIVDVSLLLKESHAAARRFMGPFVAALKNAPTAARYLVIDEADEFMPEHASGAVTQLFGDLKWIVRRGRIEGWRMLMVTQRPQDIAKSVLTQCETLVVHRLPSPQDRKAVEEWVKGHAEPGQAKEVLQSLASLQTGEAWVWSPRHDVLVRAKMPANRSEDRSRTPDAADAPRDGVAFKAVDVEALRAALAPVDPDAATGCADDVMPGTTDQWRSGALALENARLRKQLEAERDEHTIELATGQQQLNELRNIIGRARRELDAAFNHDVPGNRPGGCPSGDAGQTAGPADVSPRLAPRPAARPAAAGTAIAKSSGEGNASPGASLPRSAQAMIDALARFHPRALSIEHVAKIAGVSVTSSAWRTNQTAFRHSPLVTLADGGWRISDAGVTALGLPEKPDDPAALRQFWLGAFPPSTAAMLSVFLSDANRAFGRDAIADRAGVSRTSSGLGAGLRELVAHGLIVKRGDLYMLGDALK